MKKIFLIFSLLLISMIGFATTNEEVELEGSLAVASPKSQSQPIKVLLSDTEITVNFLDCLNKLTVVVETEKGMPVYNETVNSCETKSISINIKNLPSGWYKIKIADKNGGYLEGWFLIE
jgi:hypothetical protein